jgi:hypothetical protein
MTSCNNSWPATPEQQRWDTRENTRQRRRGVAAAANAEDWGISAGIRRIRDGGRECLPWRRNGIWGAGFQTGFFVTRKISGRFVSFVGGAGVCDGVLVVCLGSAGGEKP